MMLYIFDKTEKLVAILNNDGNACPYWDAIHEEKLNGENTFSFSVPADHNDSQYVVEGNLVAFRDLDQNWQMFEIRRLLDQHGDDLTKTAYCEHVYYELIDDILTDVRPYNVSASFALEQALQNSRWEVGTVDDLGINSTNFYYESALSAVQKVANTWGGELQYRISVTGGTISNRYVDLIARRGKITGKQFEYTKDIKEIKREVDTTNIITACYGRGKGEEVGSTENGATYGRRITFANVEWSTANGDQADKPLGQEWVGDDEALAQWGRNGRHRFGIYLDDEETDPATLLQKTWDYLQKNKTPKVTYQLSVLDLERLSGYKHEAVRLGDTVNIIDRAFDPALKISARVIEIKRNLLLPEDTEIVLGNFAPTLSDTLAQQQHVISNVRDRQGVWDRATQFNPDGTLDTSWLNGVINTLQNELLGGGGTVKINDNDGILILDNATTPTKALMFKGGIFGIANSKDANGNWIWRTFGTGDGFTADLINAGQIQTSLVKIIGNTNFYWDSDNIYIINPSNTNQQIRLGKYDGANLGIAFTTDGGATWTQALTFTGINASSITTGTLNANRIAAGSITADKLKIGSTKTSSLYVRGTGLNRTANRIVRLDGIDLVNGTGRGLTLTVLNRSDHSHVSSTTYDVYGSDTARTDLANALNALGNDKIVILTSYDAIRFNAALEAAIERCGGGSVKDSYLATNYRLPYLLIGIPGIGKGKGIEIFTSTASDAPYAEISTLIVDGTPVGINTGFTNTTIIDGSQIITGSITADKIYGGTLTLGGANNANGVMNIKDASGVIKARGDVNGFFILDKGVNVSLESKNNLIPDHSFEAIPTSGSADATYYDFAIGTLSRNLFDWLASGSPRILSARNTDIAPEAAFGLQCVVVNSSNWLYVYVPVKPSTTYYLSGYTARGYRNPTAGTPKLYVDFRDGNLTYISAVSRTFTPNTSMFDWKRVGFSFTTPDASTNVEFARIVVYSADANYVYWDGIQLVEGAFPAIYDPEENLWRAMYGVAGLQGFKAFNTNYVRRGSATINDSTNTTISFGITFPGIPTVVASYHDTKSGDWGIVKTRNTSTTSFDAIIGGTTSGLSRVINWIAIYY